VLLSLQGNLEFVDDDQEQASVVNSDENLNVISFLLGSEPRHVEKALCYRVVAAGQTEVVDKGHHAVDAAHGRDALAKVITGYDEHYFMFVKFLWFWIVIREQGQFLCLSLTGQVVLKYR